MGWIVLEDVTKMQVPCPASVMPTLVRSVILTCKGAKTDNVTPKSVLQPHLHDVLQRRQLVLVHPVDARHGAGVCGRLWENAGIISCAAPFADQWMHDTGQEAGETPREAIMLFGDKD